MEISFCKHSIRRVHEQSGNLGVSPNLITARHIAEVKGEDYMYQFLFDLTGMTKQDYENRVVTNVESSRKAYEQGETWVGTPPDQAEQKMQELREFLEYHEKLYYTEPEKVEIFKKQAIISWTFKKFKSFEKYKFTSGACAY